MIKVIIRNEWRRLSRSRISLFLLSALIFLSICGIWQTSSQLSDFRNLRSKAASYMRDKFTGQGEVNPHSAAHYGHYVYKPLSSLSVVDEGVNAFTGVSLRLEGHRQNEALHATAQSSSSLLRFGNFNLSMILQVLLPLLIIFTCYNVVSREKEDRTLHIILAQGTSLRQILLGKILAYAAIWTAFLLLTFSIILLNNQSAEDTLPLARMGSLIMVYLLYYAIITALTIYVSARSSTSANALLLMLFSWLICTVLLPKATANIGGQSVPLILRLELDKRVAEDNKNGLNGHDPRNERTKSFRDSLIKAYKVDSVSQLPVNIDGLTMQADEEYHNKVYDLHFGTVETAIAGQNRLTAYSAFINPFAALSNISMGLSGTDSYHHFDFTREAEHYRREMIEKMNHEQAFGGSRTGDWDWKVSSRFWQTFKDFKYTSPELSWAIKNNLIEFSALLLWFTALMIIILRSTKLKQVIQ